MLKKLILLWGCFWISFSILAKDTKIVGFDQAFNLNSDHMYQLELSDLNPADQFWTAIYLVGYPKAAGSNSKLDFVIMGEGLLEKNHPTQPGELVTLVAQDLPLRKNYSFKEFDDLVDEIEEQTGKKVQDPYLTNKDNIRVYGKIWDWIPEYNLNKPAKIMFGVQNDRDFEIKAAYLVVGEGEKTPQLLKLNVQPYSSDPHAMNDPVKKAERNLVKFEAKLMIFFTIAAALIFLNWGKWRRQ